MKEIAIEAAKKAGAFLMSHIDTPTFITNKNLNPTTQEDLDAEKIITQLIASKYPDHSFLGEEFGLGGKESEYVWIIDPIDGTNNYLEGRDTFSVSIALEKNKKIILGVVYIPKRDELFVAETGLGATLNGEPIHISPTDDIADAVVTYSAYPGSEHTMKTLEEKLIQQMPNLKNFGFAADKRDPMFGRGSMAAELCYLACGRIDGVIRLKQKPWDVAAGSLIAEEAGAHFCNLGLEASSPYEGDYIGANPILFLKLKELVGPTE